MIANDSCGVTLSQNLISHHVVCMWIIIYTLIVETTSHLHSCTALLCYFVLAHLQAPVGASFMNTDSARIACAVSDLILSQIQPTILLTLQTK